MSVNVQRREIMTNVLLSLAAVYGLKPTIMGDFIINMFHRIV